MTLPNATAGAPRPLRKLHAQMLTETEMAKLDMFLRIGGQRLACEWSLVSEGHVDVLLLDGDEPNTIVGLVDNPSVMVRVVNGPGVAEDQQQLIRPLEYEPFVDLLSRLESIGSPIPAQPTPVEPAAASAARAAGPKAAASSCNMSAGARIRLHRWPSSALLQATRYNTRLASFLLTRHLTLEELARLSNVKPEQCREFVETLSELTLLDVETPQPTPTSMRPDVRAKRVEPEGATAYKGPRLDVGLFGRIRRSLGIGGAI